MGRPPPRQPGRTGVLALPAAPSWPGTTLLLFVRLGGIDGWQHDAFEGIEPLLNLAEGNLDRPQTVIEATEIRAKLGDFGANGGILRAQAGILGKEQATNHDPAVPPGCR